MIFQEPMVALDRLIAAGIAVVIITAVTAVCTSLSTTFNTISGKVL